MISQLAPRARSRAGNAATMLSGGGKKVTQRGDSAKALIRTLAFDFSPVDGEIGCSAW